VLVRRAFRTALLLPQRVGAFAEAFMLRLMPEIAVKLVPTPAPEPTPQPKAPPPVKADKRARRYLEAAGRSVITVTA
jgi:hypothetical protein